MRDADLRQRDITIPFVNLNIVFPQTSGNLRHPRIVAHINLGWTRDNQRRTSFVDEDVINLINDGEIMSALDAVLENHRHIIAEIVKTKFIICAVGDVCCVGFFSVYELKLMLVFLRRFFCGVVKIGFFAMVCGRG